jgi:predicted RNase H-like HicB family nuclease
MHRALIIIEKAENNYPVYSPNLPGCIAPEQPVKKRRR